MSPRARARNSVVRHLVLHVALACVAVLAIAPAARAVPNLKIHDFARGAVAAYNVCTPQSNGDSLCEDFIVQYVRPDIVVLEHFKPSSIRMGASPSSSPRSASPAA